MKEEIAQSYKRMRQNPPPVIYSQPQKPAAASTTDRNKQGYEQIDSTHPVDAQAEDDDFDIGAGVKMTEQSAMAAESSATIPLAKSADESATIPLAKSDNKKAEPKPTASTPEESQSPVPSEAADKPAEQPKKIDAEGPKEAHSEATGGDALLDVALQEEQETEKRRKMGPRRRKKSGPRLGIIVYCPNGHRIEVQEKHRGKAGRCPRCKITFMVPVKTWAEQQKEEAAAAEQAVTAEASESNETTETFAGAGKFVRFLSDVHVHEVDPQKMKLKPGSMAKTFQEFQFGFSPDGILVYSLVPKKAKGSRKKKKDDVREEVLEYLKEESNPIEDLPTLFHHFYDIESLSMVGVALPTPYEHESMFVGVPVFGEGRIAVRIPKTEDSSKPQFATFTLSEFRVFAAILTNMYNFSNLGIEEGIPMEDVFSEVACHYSEEKFRTLESPEFHQVDPAFTLTLVGRKCQGCGLVVSEDSRKKEKIGGKNGKGIAKAKCPKCEEKFGDISLFDLEQTQEKPTEDAATEPPVADEPAPESATNPEKSTTADAEKK